MFARCDRPQFSFNNVAPEDVVEFHVSRCRRMTDIPAALWLLACMQLMLHYNPAEQLLAHCVQVYDHNRLIKDAHMGEGSMSLRQVRGLVQ